MRLAQYRRKKIHEERDTYKGRDTTEGLNKKKQLTKRSKLGLNNRNKGGTINDIVKFIISQVKKANREEAKLLKTYLAPHAGFFQEGVVSRKYFTNK